ncbi:hypothetical protein YB2330_004931 [Saitoella coloradoensis]
MPSTRELTLASTLKLNDGNEIPYMGLGVWKSSTCDTAVTAALKNNYRHIDTARAYGNEREVGEGIRASGVPRSEIFVTSKINDEDHGYDSTLRCVDESLELLGLDYIDLYLIHNPRSGTEKRLETWRALEKCVEVGKVRSIGVSNYAPQHIQEILDSNPKIKPAINQIELHPYSQQREITDYCKEKGIALTAYAPLTRCKHFEKPEVVKVAEKHGVTTPQVLVRWNLEKGYVVLPKSEKEDRIKSNADVYGFSLDEEDMKLLDTCDKGDCSGMVCSWRPMSIP